MALNPLLMALLLAETTMGLSNPQSAASQPTPSSVAIAVCQILVIDSDRSGNFARIERALAQTRDAGAEIACFPESAILGWQNPDAHQLAEPTPGRDTQRLGELARHYGLMICIGVDEKDGDKLYGGAVIIDRDGRLLLKHRKIDVLAELMDPPYSRPGASRTLRPSTRGSVGSA